MQSQIKKAKESGDKELLEHIFFCITQGNTCWELLNDGFGNYLIQKVCENATSKQLTLIIESLQTDPFHACRNPHGTRSVQKIIEIITHQEHFDLLRRIFKDFMKKICYDVNGNHVI